jgi:hypothetical protein
MQLTLNQVCRGWYSQFAQTPVKPVVSKPLVPNLCCSELVLKIVTVVLAINAGVSSWHKTFKGPAPPSQVALSMSTGLMQVKLKGGYNDANRIMMRSMFTVWLVEDIDAFQGKIFSDSFQPSSDRDRVLDVEVQYEGWEALLFGALGASLENYRDWVAKWESRETSDLFLVPRYPMLSRLNDNLVDVAYTRSEVKALRQEALNLIGEPINEQARNLLRVIIDICDEAQRQNLAIYLLAP